jgi:hypothetical protein
MNESNAFVRFADARREHRSAEAGFELAICEELERIQKAETLDGAKRRAFALRNQILVPEGDDVALERRSSNCAALRDGGPHIPAPGRPEWCARCGRRIEGGDSE